MAIGKDFTFSVESTINADRATVWKHVTQMKNVNAELMPYARMTYPADKAEIGGREVPFNQTLFTSIVFLFGFIPIDVHYLKFDKIVPGFAFYENSTTWTHQYWKHTRTLTENVKATIVRDEVHFCPKVIFLGFLFLPLLKFVFGNRHKQLAKAFS